MITTLQYLGIYEETIENAVLAVENAMKQCDLSTKDIEELHGQAIEELKIIGKFDDITNCIIFSYFNTGKWIIEQKTENTCDYYVNCYDSHFYLNEEEC